MCYLCLRAIQSSEKRCRGNEVTQIPNNITQRRSQSDHSGTEILEKDATVLPSSVRPCSLNAFSTNEGTTLSKTRKPWHPEPWTLIGYAVGVKTGHTCCMNAKQTPPRVVTSALEIRCHVCYDRLVTCPVFGCSRAGWFFMVGIRYVS